MSIYDKASLVLIPSGTKTSKVYSQKPVNGDGDFTFSRSTAATRVNADGNIEKETQNLLLQSNQFDTTWLISGSTTLTSGQSGYDGSNDAWLLSKSSGQYRRIYQSVAFSGVCTLSVYAKANTTNQITLRDGSTNARVRYNLSDGSLIDTAGTPITHSITSVGNGWYRCSLTMTSSVSPNIYVDWSQSTAGSIYIQDAQLEQGLVARDYIETTTSAVEGGITDNVPRLDYTDASCPSLLLEPQRTNYIDHSEYYDIWLKAGTTPTFTENYGTSPEGLQNSTRVQLDNNELFYRTFTLSSGAYVLSVFAKDISGGGSKITLRIDTPATKVATFDLSDGSVDTYTSDNALIEDYGNGWYRCMLVQNNDAIVNAVIAEGDNGLDCEIYGAMLEAGSYATSYIPTYGSAVTRNKDFTQMSLLSFDLTGSFSMHYHFGKTQKFKTLSTSFAHYNTDTNDFFLYTNSSGNDGLNIYMDGPNGGYVFGSGQNDAWSTDESKICITYDATTGRLAYFINGVKFNEQTNFLSFGNAVSNPNFQGDENIVNINRYLFFTQALTDQEAIDLTTL